MNYRITHKTVYKYKHQVSVGNHAVYLTPRNLPNHRCNWHELSVSPAPAMRSERTDYFGNQTSFFSIHEPHEELEIIALSQVCVSAPAVPWPQTSVGWEKVASSLRGSREHEDIEACQFVFESPRIRPNLDFAIYAARSFTPGRPIAEAAFDLTQRIFQDFRFDSKATNVRTPPEEVFRRRRGVCQDFAHLQIACMRSLNLPARYVSGYLRTYPPPGKPRMIGADASHAWVSFYCPEVGWLDVDPTNNMVPSQSHVTLAWGRDYGDLSPVRGVILGGRDHTLEVEVDMEPLE